MQRIHPGLLLVATLGAAGLGERLAPLHLPAAIGETGSAVALGLLAGAVCLGAWAARTMRSVDTPIEPGLLPRALVVTGPFRYTRNPLYLALLQVSGAFTALTASLWFAVGTAAIGVALNGYVIPREERELAELFGDKYEHYVRRVRRWL